MLKVYGDIVSGNCYKVKLLLSLLGREHEWIHLDIMRGDAHKPQFLALNPNGKVPTVVLEDGRVLTESNAILHYFAEGSSFLPSDPYLHAKVLQWQFFEQYSHEPYIAVARFIAKYLGLPDDRREDYLAKQAGGHKALQVMESQLQQTPFLIGDTYTIADISLYGYTHVADEGGFDVERYPAIVRWLARVKSHPRHVTMEQFLAA